MEILALDLGNRTGWATRSDKGYLDFGSWRLYEDAPGDPGRFVRLKAHIEEAVPMGQLGLLALELAPMLRSRAANATLHGMAAIAQCWAYDWDIPWTAVAPSTIKKHATGSGRSNKHCMLNAARERWGNFVIKTDDEADALWLMDYVIVNHFEQPSSA